MEHSRFLPGFELTRAHVGPRASARASVAAALFTCLFAPLAHAFDHADVTAKARQLADKPYEAPPPVPEILRRPNLNYDQHRDVRFKTDRSLFRTKNGSFEVQLFHPGFVYEYGVTINLIEGGKVTTLPFKTDLFDYGKNTFADKIPSDLGYAGFRIHAPINRKDYLDEVIAFAGASYFRAVSKGTVYGLSARGLAIDTGLPSGEEFPVFREFWLEQPAPKSKTMTIHALLDSPRVTGAYTFVVEPGKVTKVDVTATLFQREKVKELGIAPLTSMFFYGGNTLRPKWEWRPEVHDSDGLFMINGNGERLWRPLSNESRLRLVSFYLENPKGFGLLQRDRDFRSYEDLETHMEMRPNAWVIPKGQWGKGYIKLTEIPTHSEYNDNIVAYWVPEKTPDVKQPLNVEYRIEWGTEQPSVPTLAHATDTRVGYDFDYDQNKPKNRRVIIEFDGDALRKLPEDAPVEADVTVGKGGELIEKHVTYNRVTKGRRISFALNTEKDKPVELRAFLKLKDQALSETWTYLLEPSPPEK